MISSLNRFIGSSLCYVFPVAALLAFIEVISRYLFNSPTQISIEITIFIAALHYIMCGAQAIADDTHIRVTVLTDRLPRGVQRLLRSLERVLVIGVCSVIAVWASFGAQFSIQIFERSGSNWNLPTPMILKVTIAVGMGLMALQSLEDLVNGLRGRDDS